MGRSHEEVKEPGVQLVFAAELGEEAASAPGVSEASHESLGAELVAASLVGFSYLGF
jgi:hypothetical protein